MKKKIFWVIILIILFTGIGAGLFLYFNYHLQIDPALDWNCASQNEEAYYSTDSLFDEPNLTAEMPSKCCEGLKKLRIQYDDEAAIGNGCYGSIGTTSRGLYGGYLCSACGNGICQGVENVCNCPEDCVGKNSSYKAFKSFEDFCKDTYYCSDQIIGPHTKACVVCVYGSLEEFCKKQSGMCSGRWRNFNQNTGLNWGYEHDWGYERDMDDICSLCDK